MAEKHTPGPWSANGRYIGTQNHMSAVAECRDVNGNWCDDAKSSANARLIVRLVNLYFAGQEAERQQDTEIRSRGYLPPDRNYGLSEGEQVAALMMNGLMEENEALVKTLEGLCEDFSALAEGRASKYVSPNGICAYDNALAAIAQAKGGANG